MADVKEVVCTLPFTPRKSAAYNFIVSGNLIVLEDGVRKFDTKTKADPKSMYSLRGNKVIRTYNPARDAKEAKSKAKAESTLSSKAYRELVADIVKKQKAKKATPFGDDDDPVRGMLVPAKKLVSDYQDDVDAVRKLQAHARKAAASLFLTRFPGDFDSYIAIIPTDDPFEALALVECGGDDIDVAPIFRALHKDAGVTMTRIQFDTIEARLDRVPKNLAKHAKALASLGDEGSSTSTATKMLKSKKLFFWWD